MSQAVNNPKELKPSFDKRLREIYKALQMDRTGKEIKKRTSYLKPSQKRVLKMAQRRTAILKAQRRKNTHSRRKDLLHIFECVH